MKTNHFEASSHRRVEDIRFLKGEGQFTDDLKSPKNKIAYMGLVRSPYAHAKISKIDFSEARENPDFVDCLTGQDVDSITNPITVVPGTKETGRKQLAVGEARFVGEPVAAFVSKTRYSLEDIGESIAVEYEEMPAVLGIGESKEGQVKVFDGIEDNLFYKLEAKKGDAERKIASSSDSAIKAKITIKRQSGVPIEPRSYIAEYDERSDSFTVISSAQRPHGIQNYLSNELRAPTNKFHVVVKDVGGAFGTKGAQSYCEPVLACIFAKRTGYSVKATTTRTDDLLETAAGRDQVCEIELACDGEGKLTALKANVEADVGVSGTLSISPRNTVQLLPEVYAIPNLDLMGSCYLTNKPPLGPVRGAGRPEADYFMELAMDALAVRLGMDPLEFRKKNLVHPEQMPYDNGAGSRYDSGNFPLLLQKLAPTVQEMRRWREEVNGREGTVLLAGTGLCIEVEDTGAQFKESAKVSIGMDGRVELTTGSTPQGQGLETSLAQLCAQELGVPFDYVTVRYGDTKTIPFSIGTFGSRSMAVGGSAVAEATKKAKEEILDRASKLYGVGKEDVGIENGNIVKVEHERIGTTTLESIGSLIGKTGEIEVYSEFTLKSMPFASGAHACSVTVDKETGRVRVHRYVAVDDCGVEINPMIVEGQLHGGIVHGLGGSLLEEMVYSDSGQLLTTNFLDYNIATSLDIPDTIEILHIETPSPLTLNGSKGVGESGTIAAYPCILNAINNALIQVGRRASRIHTAPVSPEDILRVLGS